MNQIPGIKLSMYSQEYFTVYLSIPIERSTGLVKVSTTNVITIIVIVNIATPL